MLRVLLLRLRNIILSIWVETVVELSVTTGFCRYAARYEMAGAVGVTKPKLQPL